MSYSKNNSPYKPSFIPSPQTAESPAIQTLINALSLQPHIEGGYFAETDRASDVVRTPFPSTPSSTTGFVNQRPGFDPALRSSSTSIFYLLTPNGPQGGFHRNKGRTVHTLHRGRGRYVIIHQNRMVESFIVGQDVEKGERLQWVVEGGKYKASFLLPDVVGGSSEGLLISETVVPGFEYCDHDFLTKDGLRELRGDQGVEELGWLLSPLVKK